MSQCIYLEPGGLVRATTEAPAQCAGYVMLTREEYSAAVNPIIRPLSMTEGATISIAIVGLWTIAFVYRSIRGGLTKITGGNYE